MNSNSKSKWKTLRLPDQANSFCSSIEVLDDYKELKKLKRKTSDDIKDNITTDKHSAPKKKKRNIFEIRNEKNSISEREMTNLKEGKYVESFLSKSKKVKNDGGNVKHEHDIGKIGRIKKKKNKSGKPALNIEAFNMILNESRKQEGHKSTQSKVETPKKVKLKQKKRKKFASDEKKDEAVIVAKESNDVKDDLSKFDADTDMSDWKSLHVCDEILLALKAKGFTNPTPIQRLTLPMALAGRRDIVGAAETGSGKTLAFCIPIIQGILRDRKREENGEEIEGDNELADLEKEDEESEEEETDEDIENKDYFELDDIENKDEVELADLGKEDESEEEEIENKNDFELDDIDIQDDESEEEDSVENIENKNDDELDDLDIENDESEDSAEDTENKYDDEFNDLDIENDESGDEDSAEDTENKDMNEKKNKKKFQKREKKKPISKLDKFRINFGKQTELPVEDSMVEDSIENFVDYAVENNDKKLRALILTPTRELAVQIKNHIQDILKMTNVTIAVIVGGMSADKQLRLLRRCPDIVVGTPGRLWELYQEGNPHLQKLSNINYLAIDETDRMGEKGHFIGLGSILEAVGRGQTHKQRFVMSATLSLVHKAPVYKKVKKMPTTLTPKQKLKELMVFAGVGQRRKIVDLTSGASTARTLSESAIHCDTMKKDFYVYYFIKTHKGRTIVFCNSIDCVRRVASTFEHLDVTALPLHAQMHQKARLKNLERFVERDDGLLIATDVAARGLDIPNIDHVIHYQVPRTCEMYIHRSGRTARANKSGLSVLLIDLKEKFLYNKITSTLKRKEDLPLFPVDEIMFNGLSKRVELAKELNLLVYKERRKKSADEWISKAAKEADLLLSDDEDIEDKALRNWRGKIGRQEIDTMRKELNALLSNQVYKLRPTKYPSELLNKFGASIQASNPSENVVGYKTGSIHNYGGASALHALKENQQQQINKRKELTKMRNKKRGNRPRKKNQKA